MRRTRTVLTSGLFSLILIADASAQSAADECLTKPDASTPQGQHWYYRIDHANGGRQCWYLRAEDARAQKPAPKAETNPADAMAQTRETSRAAAPAANVETLPEKKAPVAVAPVRWLNVQKLPEPNSFIQAATPPRPESSRTAETTASAETAAPARSIESTSVPVAVSNRPAPDPDGNSVPTPRSRELQRRQQAQARPEPPAPPIVVKVDHTFALLMIMFVALTIAGPALHFVERRRRRETIRFRPPPLARVVAPNAPASRVHPPMTPRVETVNRPAPMPRPSDQTERLAHALQQIVDRLQSVDHPEPKTVRMRPHPKAVGRASM